MKNPGLEVFPSHSETKRSEGVESRISIFTSMIEFKLIKNHFSVPSAGTIRKRDVLPGQGQRGFCRQHKVIFMCLPQAQAPKRGTATPLMESMHLRRFLRISTPEFWRFALLKIA